MLLLILNFILLIIELILILILLVRKKSENFENKIKFRIYTPEYNDASGGIIVLHLLCEKIISNGYDCKLISMNDNIPENKYKKIYTYKNDIQDSIVIYPEIISGNPLNAKKVIRWILCELGSNCDRNIYKTWDKNDIIYFYATFNPKISVSKYLFCIDLDKSIINYNKNERKKDCFEIRKSHKFHKNLKFIHPKDSYEIKNLPLKERIKIFNNHRYYYCYDPYCGNIIVAGLCGCIPIIVPIENISKKDWTKTLPSINYLNENKKDYLYGFAYGIEDIEYAKNTNNLIYEEQNNIIKYGEKTIVNMINDIKNNNLEYVKDYYKIWI
jgi:hypothetical protein